MDGVAMALCKEPGGQGSVCRSECMQVDSCVVRG